MAFGDIIQRAEGSNNGVSSIAATFSGTPVSGNLIVAVHMTGATNSSGCSSSSGSYASALALTNATESDEAEIYYRIAGASEATEVTATSSASDENAILLIEIEGPFEASPVDLAEAEARTAGAASYALATSGTTSQADEVAVAAVYTRDAANNGAGMTWSDSFVKDDLLSDAVTSAKSIHCATKLLTATGTVSTTLTYAINATGVGGIVTFKQLGAGGGSSIAAISNYYRRLRAS